MTFLPPGRMLCIILLRQTENKPLAAPARIAVNDNTTAPGAAAMKTASALLAALLAAHAFAAAPPSKADPKRADKTIREVAGSAEYLRGVPKKFAVLRAIDGARHRVTLLLDGDKQPTEWPLLDDAEV